MTLDCLIADDEALARRLMADYVDKAPGLNLVHTCANGIEVLDAIRSRPVDLLLLDIQMPGLTGIELVRSLRRPPMVIFTTAYSEYALESYELDVIDYLVKPIPFDRFLHAAGKAADYQALRKPTDMKDNSPEAPAYFFVKSGRRLVRVRYEDILSVEGLKEYISIWTPEGRTITLASLRDYEEMLPGRFMRVHKSWIVAMDKVEWYEGGMLKVGGKEVPVGKSYREAVVERFSGMDLKGKRTF